MLIARLRNYRDGGDNEQSSFRPRLNPRSKNGPGIRWTPPAYAAWCELPEAAVRRKRCGQTAALAPVAPTPPTHCGPPALPCCSNAGVDIHRAHDMAVTAPSPPFSLPQASPLYVPEGPPRRTDLETGITAMSTGLTKSVSLLPYRRKPGILDRRTIHSRILNIIRSTSLNATKCERCQSLWHGL